MQRHYRQSQVRTVSIGQLTQYNPFCRVCQTPGAVHSCQRAKHKDSRVGGIGSGSQGKKRGKELETTT